MKLKSLLAEESTTNAFKIKHEIRQGKNLSRILALEKFSGITVRFVETDGFVRLLLEIGDQTTHKDIRDAIPDILMWRDKLLEMQSIKIGYDLLKNIEKPSNRAELLEHYSYLQEHGATYASLAKHFNQLVSGCLKKHWEYKQKDTITSDELYTMNLSEAYATTLLKAVGISDTDVEMFWQNGLERLANHEFPFEKGYPVSRQKMIEVLRSWRTGRLHKDSLNAIEKAQELLKNE